MRLATVALVLLTLTAACSNSSDDDDGATSGEVELDFADFQEAPLGECEVIVDVFNTSGSRFCDVVIRHEAFDFDGDFIGDALSTVTGLPPDTGDTLTAPILTTGGNFVDCLDVESIELVEFDDICD